MRYEVIERKGRTERVVTTTRREAGAANERDRQVQATYENEVRHAASIYTRVVRGADGEDPNAVVVATIDRDGVKYVTVTYRRVGGEPEQDLTEVLLASLYAVGGATL